MNLCTPFHETIENFPKATNREHETHLTTNPCVTYADSGGQKQFRRNTLMFALQK